MDAKLPIGQRFASPEGCRTTDRLSAFSLQPPAFRVASPGQVDRRWFLFLCALYRRSVPSILLDSFAGFNALDDIRQRPKEAAYR